MRRKRPAPGQARDETVKFVGAAPSCPDRQANIILLHFKDHVASSGSKSTSRAEELSSTRTEPKTTFCTNASVAMMELPITSY
jgi:hypothetical protein